MSTVAIDMRSLPELREIAQYWREWARRIDWSLIPAHCEAPDYYASDEEHAAYWSLNHPFGRFRVGTHEESIERLTHAIRFGSYTYGERLWLFNQLGWNAWGLVGCEVAAA